MGDKPWGGEPRWTGKEFHDIDLTDCVFPCIGSKPPFIAPFMLYLEHCEDVFLPVFTSVEDLRLKMEYWTARLELPPEYTIKKIEETAEFCDSIWSAPGSKIRIMLDPIIVNDHHTKWKEVIKNGDQYKYVKSEQ